MDLQENSSVIAVFVEGGREFHLYDDGKVYYKANNEEVPGHTSSDVWLRCGIYNAFTHPDTNQSLLVRLDEGGSPILTDLSV